MSTGSGDPVATYFNIVAPWENDTFINVHAFLFDAQTNKLVPKASRAARDPQEAISFAHWAISMGWEVYACMASQRTPGTAKADKRGRVNYRALRGVANSVSLKAFYLDVDVKPGAYGDTQEAVQALQGFCATIGLPRPSLLVYSGGGGFHAYWVLKNNITLDEWRALTPSLAEACRRHGLKADHNVTVNAAQILRVPGSSNRKYGAPRPVTQQIIGPAVDIERIKVALIPYQQGTAPVNSGVAPQGYSQNDSLDPTIFRRLGSPLAPGHILAGISPDLYTLDEVATGCPWVRDTLKDGGKGQREPLWFEAAHVAVFTAEGIKDFHRLSKGHDAYSADATDAKFQRVLDNKQATDQGWPRCETIENAGATQCAGCPHKNLKKSPLNFAVKTFEETPSKVTPPGNGTNNPQAPGDYGDKKTFSVPGYMHHQVTGIVSYEVLDKKGNPHEENVLNCAIWDPKYREDQRGQFAVHFDTMLAKQQWKHVIVPNVEMRNGDTVRACLLRYGVSVHPGQEKGVLEYMAAFKDQMREARDNIERQELMGWVDEDGTPAAFIYGPTRFNCNGNTHFNQPDTMIKAQYFPTGSPDPWLEAIRMINAEKRPEMDVLVATAFAAPLMKFAGEKGVVVSAFSSATAMHKTTALKIGQAVWGSFKSINQLSDTANSVLEKTGKTRVVPTYFDEMKSSMDVKRFAGMIYTFTGGKGKGRLNRNAEIKDVDTWDTLLVAVSNDSLFDCVAQYDTATDAGIARVFEFEVAPPNSAGQIDMGAAGELLKKLETNYGHAGLKYAEYLGKSVATLQDRVTAKIKQVQQLLNAKDPERFWISAAAVLLVGAEIANEIGLAKFDLLAMENFIALTVRKMRAMKISSDLDISKSPGIAAALASYINTHRRQTLATDTIGQSARGGISQVAILNLPDIQHVQEFSIRYIQITNTLRLSQSALRTWLKEKNLPPGVFIKNMLGLYGGKELVTNLTAGTSRPSAKERVIELDLNHPDLVGLYDI